MYITEISDEISRAYLKRYRCDMLNIYLLAGEGEGAMIVCFAAHKGGTGKTTSSVNLAACLARTGKRTLLIDMDPQAHASMALGMTIGYEDPSTADLLSERPPALAKIVQPTAVPRLSVVPRACRVKQGCTSPLIASNPKSVRSALGS